MVLRLSGQARRPGGLIDAAKSGVFTMDNPSSRPMIEEVRYVKGDRGLAK